MEWESKKELYRSEKMLMKITLPLGWSTYKKKRRKNLSSVFTVAEMLSAAGVCVEEQSEEIRSKAATVVSGVCRLGSRFTKDCICVQLYEDAVDLMTIAMEKGALFCVTRHPVDGVPCVVVDDPSRAYADMCRLYRREEIATTAIVGSIGKTTAKKMVQSVFQTQENTLCDAGNDNQLDCVGYICQHIPRKTTLWVQEVSEDTKGCVEQISKIVQPNLVIITAIDKSHIEEFGDEQGILDEIASITKYMKPDGICITSMDDENTATLIKDRRTVFVSMQNTDADFYSKDVCVNSDGLKFNVIEKKSGYSYAVQLKNVYARHNVYSALYAFAAGVLSGISYDNIVKGLEVYKATGIRQNVYKARGIIVYADCYNAVAKSVRSAVAAADNIPIQGKRVAVLGDIAETGAYAKATHEEIVTIVNDSNFDVLIAYGENLRTATESVETRKDLKIIKPMTRNELNRETKQMAKRGDLVLFKSSHSVGLEKTLKATFPIAYMRKLWEFLFPLIKWRFIMLFH